MPIAINIDNAVRNISDIYYGDRSIDKVYYGSRLVFDAHEYDVPVDPIPTPTPTPDPSPISVKTAYYLLVGMDTYKNNRIEKSTGHIASVNLIKDALLKYGVAKEEQIHVLLEADTTKQNVADHLAAGIQNDFMFFFVNTHGGASTRDKSGDEQEYAFEGANNSDGRFSLYDANMTDDEFWNIIKNAKDRVFSIFCTCHSGTMFRAVNPFAGGQTPSSIEPVYNQPFGLALQKYASQIQTVQKRTLFSATTKKNPREYNETNLKLINWSACHDNLVSYRSASGHFLAQAISRLYGISPEHGQLSYAEFWNKLTIEPTKPADYKTNAEAKRIYDNEKQAYNWAHSHGVTPILNVMGNVSEFENKRLFT